MTNAIPTDKKAILADPLSAFSACSHDDPVETKAKLEQQWQQLCQLRSQCADIRLKTKKLSRKIGEARRNKENIDALKDSMQSYGQQLKQLKQQATSIEQLILSYFEVNETDERSTGVSTERQTDSLPAQRNYKARTIHPDEIRIVKLSDEYQRWNDYVASHPAGCIHHRAEWAQLLQQSYGHESHCFIALDSDNNIVGLLPLARLKSRLFGDLLVSMPFFQRAGAIADHPLIEDKLIAAANQCAQDLGSDRVEYRDDIPRQAMPVQSHKVNMVLALPDNKTALWQSFSSKLRAQIKRPKRVAPQVLFGHTELIDDFYAVYARNMRDLGSPLHSKQFILNILQQFPENSWLTVVQLENKPVAGAFLLAYKDTMEIPLASTIRDVNHLSINMLLYWQVLKFAISKAYKNFDFGRSTKDAGTYRFKKQWGAKAKPLYWHYWLKDGAELPELNPSNPKYALVIFLWKRLPVRLSQLLGPHLVKYIP